MTPQVRLGAEALTTVALQGGPLDGFTVDVKDRNCVINIEGHGVPKGYVARYKPLDRRRRDNLVFKFDGVSKVLACVPRPGSKS